MEYHREGSTFFHPSGKQRPGAITEWLDFHSIPQEMSHVSRRIGNPVRISEKAEVDESAAVPEVSSTLTEAFSAEQNATPSGFREYVATFPLPPERPEAVVLYFDAAWSENSQRMSRSLRNSEDVRKITSEVCVFHVDSQKYPNLCKKYAVTDFPTLLSLSSDGQSIKRLVGHRQTAQVMNFLRNAKQQTTLPTDY